MHSAMAHHTVFNISTSKLGLMLLSYHTPLTTSTKDNILTAGLG
jgi:hypothetical protein